MLTQSARPECKAFTGGEMGGSLETTDSLAEGEGFKVRKKEEEKVRGCNGLSLLIFVHSGKISTCAPQVYTSKNRHHLSFMYFFDRTSNPSSFAGRVCGLKGSTHLSVYFLYVESCAAVGHIFYNTDLKGAARVNSFA